MAVNSISKAAMFRRILFKSLWVRKKRVAIAFASIVTGSAVICALASVYFDISIKMSEELRVYGANFFIGANPESGLKYVDEDQYSKIVEQIDPAKLTGASPYLLGVVRLDIGQAVMAGVDFAGLKRISPYWQVEGKWVAVDFDDRHCMIGQTLAKSMELKIGSKVNILNQETGAKHVVKVKGIMETGQAEDNQIFVTLALAQRLLEQENKLNYAMLSIVSEGFDIDGFAAGLEEQYSTLDAKPIRKVSQSEGQILEKITGLMALVAVIILSTTTLCVMTTLLAMVVERRKEIGLIKAIGAENSVVVRQFLTETTVIALIGAICGVVAGFILAQILGHAVFDSAISLRFIVIPLTLSIGVVAALVAAILPVKKAVEVEPAIVLRGE